jgi:hypothetical protein
LEKQTLPLMKLIEARKIEESGPFNVIFNFRSICVNQRDLAFISDQVF